MTTRSTPRSTAALWIALLALLPACAYHGPYEPYESRPGPYPGVYAGVTLVFDRDLGCHQVRGHPHHYFYRDHFYRHNAGHWEVGRRAQGPWRRADLVQLPGSLRQRYARAPANDAPRSRDRAEAGDRREHERADARRDRERDRTDARERRKRERERADARNRRAGERERTDLRERREQAPADTRDRRRDERQRADARDARRRDRSGPNSERARPTPERRPADSERPRRGRRAQLERDEAPPGEREGRRDVAREGRRDGRADSRSRGQRERAGARSNASADAGGFQPVAKRRGPVQGHGAIRR